VNTGCDVTVVVPLYGTEQFLGELASRTASTLDAAGLSHEMIFVDDRSPGGDLAVACSLARDDDRVGVVGMAHNVGQNLALIVGMSYGSGRWTVLIDGDLQDPPEIIPSLIDVGMGGFDAVFGGRTGNYQVWHRRMTSRAFKKLQSWMCGVPSDACLFVALSRRMVDAILGGASLKTRVIPLIGMAGLPVTSVPMKRSRRPVGSSAYSSFRRLLTGLETVASALRLHLGVGSGAQWNSQELVVLVTGSLSGTRTATENQTTGRQSPCSQRVPAND